MGPTILLIHGFPHDHRVWDLQTIGLRGEFEVIAPDLRGFGSDNKEPVPGSMTMDAYAEDLKALLDEREIDKVVLCGLSMGGYVAMAFLEQYGERVSGLILCNTKATADDEEAKRGRYELAKKAFDKGAAVIAQGMLPKMLSEKTRTERAPIANGIEAMMAAQRPDAIAAAAQGMAMRPDRTKLLERTRIPALIITGSKDELMDSSTSKAMHNALKESDLEVIEGAAHLSNVDEPDRFNEIVISFLRRLPAS